MDRFRRSAGPAASSSTTSRAARARPSLSPPRPASRRRCRTATGSTPSRRCGSRFATAWPRSGASPAIGATTWPATSTSSSPTPPASSADALEVDRHVLRLEVLLDALVAALAAEARLLDAAERGRRVGDHALVEADHPGLEALADA